MNSEFMQALEEIEKERGVSKEIILDSIRAALVSSYKKNYNATGNVDIDVEFSGDTDKVRVLNRKTVVEEIADLDAEMSIDEAKEYLVDPQVGDIVSIEITPKNFGRIAAQTAKQVVIQKIKDAERDVIYQEYIDRENELITGQINRIRKGSCFIDLGRLEGVLPAGEQIPGEFYHVGERLKMMILEVRKTGKGPQIILSRSHPNLVRKLFELEVPEIAKGEVEIFHTAREAGSRTKIAIFSKNEEIDALGACVGFQGNRVKTIVEELGGEKIDIIIWDKDIKQFIKNSLAPADVTQVFVDPSTKSSVVFVPENQLSLAIGKEGQNARLAARLTNWKIDIKNDAELEEYISQHGEEIDEFEQQNEENFNTDEKPMEYGEMEELDIDIKEDLLKQLMESELTLEEDGDETK
ncbi:MAG: transcription termination factor NusA [Tissierellia bacterium]|nr:transcription termination factor NusA [Tissierellia bacterium]